MADIDPLPNIGSQIERAVAAYLTSVGAGTEHQNFISNDSRDHQFPSNTIHAHKSVEEVRNSRIEAYQVQITSAFPAANQPGQSNPLMNRVQVDKWVGKVMAALSQRDTGQRDYRATATAITAAGRALYVADPVNDWDMADFTCQHIHFVGSVRFHEDGAGSTFVEVRSFEIHAVPINTD